jgi:hypothetical protein
VGFSAIPQPAFSRTPRTSAANRAAALGTGVQAVTARAAAGYNLTTDWALVSEDPTGLATFGVGKYGKSYFAGMNADPSSATTEFWQQSDTFPRMALSYTSLGAGLFMGPGNTATDVALARAAPAGTSTQGLLQQNGRTFSRLGFYNVRDYGAKGDASTDDRAAIQAAVDAAAANTYGGVVFFPPGDYRVDCTTVGISLPIGVNVMLVAEGAPFNAGGAASGKIATARIRRSAGNAPLIRTSTAWTSSANPHNKCGIIGLEIDGGAQNGTVAYLPGLGKFLCERVRFTNQWSNGATNPSTPGVELIRPWDVIFSNCTFDVMGYDEANAPALMLRPIYAIEGGTSTDTVNTVQFSNCYWFANRGTDIRIAGEGVNRASHLTFVGCKAESNVGTGPRTGPTISVGLINNVMFAGCAWYFASGVSQSIVKVENQTAGGSVSLAANSFEGGSNAPIIDHLGQGVMASACQFRNYNTGVTAWRIGSAVVPFAASGAGNWYYDTTQAKRYTDARTVTTGAGNGPVGLN